MQIEIPKDKKFFHQMNMLIRWGDMDPYSYSNNTLYFRYMEQVRVEWITPLGDAVAPNVASILTINQLR